ncbi:MAG: polysaccharide biosynthesis C-terminal domain-containing protein [Barnesiella sp.]
MTVSFYPIYLMNISALTSLGRSDLYLKATLLSKMVLLGLIILAIPFGVYYMVSAGALGAFISIFIVAQWNKKLINYAIKNQLLDILPLFLLAIFTSIIVSLITFLPLDNWAILLFGSGFAVLLYLFLSFVFKVDAAIYIFSN